MTDAIPPPRLQISHLLLLTACLGLSIALAKWDRWLLRRLDQNVSAPQFPLPPTIAGVAAGQGLGLALLVLAGNHWRQGRRFVTQPGHLLGVIAGWSLVQGRCLNVIWKQVVLSAELPLFSIERISLAAILTCSCLVLLFGIFHPMSKRFWRWSMGLAFTASGAHALGEVYWLREGFFLPTAIELFAMSERLFAASMVFTTLLALLDLRPHAPRRDWQHWAGLLAVMLSGWSTVCHRFLNGAL